MLLQLSRTVHPASGMLDVVAVYLCVTLKANWDRVLDTIIAGLDVIRLDLGATEPVADAAATVASHKKSVNVTSRELASHRVGPAL